MNNQGIIIHFPEKAIDFSSPKCPDWLWGLRISYSLCTSSSYCGCKATEAWSWPVTKVKNARRHVCPLPHMSPLCTQCSFYRVMFILWPALLTTDLYLVQQTSICNKSGSGPLRYAKLQRICVENVSAIREYLPAIKFFLAESAFHRKIAPKVKVSITKWTDLMVFHQP